MEKYLVMDIATGRQIGCILAKSLHAAKCLSTKLFGYGRFNRVYHVDKHGCITG